MITAFRRNLKALSIVLWVVIAAFIGTTFVVWGTGSVPGGDAAAVATVNGEGISLDRYRRLYRSYEEFYRQVYGERLTPDLVERLGLAQQVVDALIDETLIVQRAVAEGLRVEDDELRARIQAIPAFQEGGRFSRERYLAVLSRFRVEPGAFEAEQRRDLLRRKMETTVRAGVKVSEAEVRQAWEIRREKVRALWAQAEVSALMGQVTATDEELEAHLKERPLEFQLPERRRVEYVLLAPRSFVTPVPDALVEAHYRENPSEFEQPRRVKAAHLLVRVPPVGGSEAEDKARARVAEAIRRILAGEEFQKVAREVSEDPGTAAAGGDLGFIARGEMVPAFEQAAFALKRGEVTKEPVRTPFGYHAIKVSEIQEGGRRPLKEVAGRIRERLQGERSERAAQAKAEEVRAPLLQAAREFAVEARKRGLDPRTGLLARGDALEGIGRAPALEEAVFSAAVGGVAGPVRTPAGFVVFRVAEHLPAAVPPLAEIRARVAEAVKRRKAEALALERARALVEAVGKGEEFLAAAKKRGLPGGDAGFFSRAEPPAERRLPGEVLRAALESPAGKLSEPVAVPQGVFVVKVLERRPPDAAGFESEREELRRQLSARKQEQVWEAWVRGLRTGAKIQVAAGSTRP
jgi:peptidyl-prolyl cis-trans isomerase D